MPRQIEACRICGNKNLSSIINIGNQALTGVFPASKEEEITIGPLEIVKCMEDGTGQYCGLVQLKYSYDLNEMYGLNYGYRSSLNSSMVDHLHSKLRKILKSVDITSGDLLVDIGSNDCTLLKDYPDVGAIRVGIDPTGIKFKEYYSDDINLIPEFFSEEVFKKHYPHKKAKIITSIAMFYDLEDPIKFMKDIHSILADDGVWVFEQSYMPNMLDNISYDTICHEHLEFYSLRQIKWMTDLVGFKINDVEFNDINGGSFSITVSKIESEYPENKTLVEQIISEEKERKLDSMEPFHDFKDKVEIQKNKLLKLIKKLKADNKTIFGYGASTKGNVLLQFCGITPDDIPYIAEVNSDKYGKYTPETLIPIISEEEAKAKKPDYFLVLPWHFRDNILEREKQFIKDGGALIFPLPEIEIVDSSSI